MKLRKIVPISAAKWRGRYKPWHTNGLDRDNYYWLWPTWFETIETKRIAWNIRQHPNRWKCYAEQAKRAIKIK